MTTNHSASPLDANAIPQDGAADVREHGGSAEVDPVPHADAPYARLGGIRAPNGPVRVLVNHHDEAAGYRQGASRHWIETRPGRGQRLCRHTLGLKRVRGKYEAAAVLFLDDAGGVRCALLPHGSPDAKIDAFERRFGAAMRDPRLASAIEQARATQ